jgi:hypothetical protein
MYYQHHDTTRAHIVIFYRNFQLKPVAGKGCVPHSHIGLGVSAMHTAKVLRKHHIKTDVFGVWLSKDIENRLRELGDCVTHAVIEAPWVGLKEMEDLLYQFPHVHFIVRSHSQVGFLQVEAGAVQLLRDYALLEDSTLNFSIAANSQRFCEFMELTYRVNCLYLPNLYDLERVHRHEYRCHKSGQTLRVGSFGAIRLLKNHSTAAAAALMLARMRDSNLEFYMNVNREEHGNGVLHAIRNLFKDLPWAKLIEVPWQPWGSFRQTVAHMDICFQVSATETFNIVTADAAAEGVPSVIGEAIDWLPREWVANIDDAQEIARIANHLLSDPRAGRKASHALEVYICNATKVWLDYLNNKKPGCSQKVRLIL